MSDGAGAAAAAVQGAQGAADQGGGAAQQQQGGGGDQQQGGGDQQQGDRWQDKFLSAELRGDERISRYGSIDDMAKGLIETQTWARGRVAIPKADDATAFDEFAGKVRPADAKDYKILDADGKESAMGERFRQTFHDVGLHPIQAERLTAAWNQAQADLVSQTTQKGRDEVHALELELGPQAFNQRASAVDSMLRAAGIEIADIATGLEQTVGAGATLRALFTMAEKTGELAKIDGATVSMRMGTMTAAQAQAEVDRMSTDKNVAAKLDDKASPEYAKRQELLKRIAKGD